MQNHFIYTDDNHLIRWREQQTNYSGKFSDIKRLCDLGSLACYSGPLMMWLFPIEAFQAFNSIYILTYMFHAQLQRYYYDYYRLPYEFIYVAGSTPETYHFTYDSAIQNRSADFQDLIHIICNDKMNDVGSGETDLSKAWFTRNQNGAAVKQLKNNLTNFFRNMRTDKASDNIWTTFKDDRRLLPAKGYARGFLPLNTQATNDYRTRTSVAYAANRYLNPLVKNFFIQHNIEIAEDDYALSELLQFIWRSAIRDNQEIWLYIPSKRMRELLEKWILDHSF